jgi:hypothetical protein
MTNYLIKRHGANANNQPMCQVKAVAIVEAESYKNAREIANTRCFCYNNQHLEIIESSDVSKEEWNAACEEVLSE